MRALLFTVGYLIGLIAFGIGIFVAGGAAVMFVITAGGGGSQEVLRYAFVPVVLPALLVAFAGWVLKGFCRERLR